MMKRKVIYKIITICLFAIIFVMCISNIANAALTSNINPNTTATSHFKKPIEVTLGVFQVVAIGLGAIMIIALGIKYMSSAAEDKAEIKKHATVYLVGACVAFGATGLIQIFKGLVVEMLK